MLKEYSLVHEVVLVFVIVHESFCAQLASEKGTS